MRATKAELLELIQSLPDRPIDVAMSRGVTSKDMPSGYVEAEPNGTMTITINVDGGARNWKEGLPVLSMLADMMSRDSA